MNKSRLYWIGFLLFSICCFIGVWLYFLFTSVVPQDGGVIYYLHQNASKKQVLADLSQQGLIQPSPVFSIYTYFHRSDHLKAGEYLFKKGSTPASIWKQITTGTGLLYHPFTIIPGWSFEQLRHELLQKQDLQHTTASLDNKQIMDRLGFPTLYPEGEFFPETYFYTKGSSDFTILKRAFLLMQAKLAEAWKNHEAGLPYKNAYEALIVASLIEKEAFLKTERPIISGVILNRLKKDMLLQIDPTVIYGLGSRYDGKIRKENLTEDTVYNTYVHKGLPPTPIAMPSLDSIMAAMHPQNHDYYYFVARGDGSHQFSKTLVEHNQAVTTVQVKQQHQSYLNDGYVNKYLYILINQHLNDLLKV